MAYLLWWRAQERLPPPRGAPRMRNNPAGKRVRLAHSAHWLRWGFVWGVEYDVASSGNWRDFMADACVLDETMAHADLLGVCDLTCEESILQQTLFF
jgi:hypothetical protein